VFLEDSIHGGLLWLSIPLLEYSRRDPSRRFLSRSTPVEDSSG
jgi:hypothetical protein